jgi:hypothetical protein
MYVIEVMRSKYPFSHEKGFDISDYIRNSGKELCFYQTKKFAGRGK